MNVFVGSKNSYEIFKYARMAIDPAINYTRYDVPRAGLKLFSKHAAQFSLYLVDDYQVGCGHDSVSKDLENKLNNLNVMYVPGD